MIVIIVISVVLIVAGKYFIDSRKKPLPTTVPQKEITYDHTPSELETMVLVNDYRVSMGLVPLKIDNYISYKSEEHTRYMISNNMASHNGFTSRSEDLMATLGAKNVGENVAYNYSTPQAVVKAWLNSPTHKENLDGDYTHFGISIRPNSNGKNYYTNMFVKVGEIK
jgi:uncharacterized protein YkwD